MGAAGAALPRLDTRPRSAAPPHIQARQPLLCIRQVSLCPAWKQPPPPSIQARQPPLPPAVWAPQADLTSRRKEFHGAVTYAFDGIFSWQMYGSTEATEDGKPYTEYLMRCQWGTTWDNMQVGPI